MSLCCSCYFTVHQHGASSRLIMLIFGSFSRIVSLSLFVMLQGVESGQSGGSGSLSPSPHRPSSTGRIDQNGIHRTISPRTRQCGSCLHHLRQGFKVGRGVPVGIRKVMWFTYTFYLNLGPCFWTIGILLTMKRISNHERTRFPNHKLSPNHKNDLVNLNPERRSAEWKARSSHFLSVERLWICNTTDSTMSFWHAPNLCSHN